MRPGTWHSARRLPAERRPDRKGGLTGVAVLLLLVVTGVVLVRLQTAHVGRVAVQRRAVLADVQQVLERPTLTQRGIDYPVLTGDYRGTPVTVAVIVDTLALRQLPTLWLSVTCRRPLPLTGPVDMLLRPSTSDIVSPGERFPVEHRVPPDWPAHLRVATPEGSSPDFSQLTAVLPLLQHQRTKDVLLAPSGARLVTELTRAELGHYRLYKRAKFDARLGADQLTTILDSLCAAMDGLQVAAAEGGRRPSTSGGVG